MSCENHLRILFTSYPIPSNLGYILPHRSRNYQYKFPWRIGWYFYHTRPRKIFSQHVDQGITEQIYQQFTPRHPGIYSFASRKLCCHSNPGIEEIMCTPDQVLAQESRKFKLATTAARTVFAGFLRPNYVPVLFFLLLGEY